IIDVISPIEPDLGKCHRYEFLQRMGDARSNNEVIGLVALKHFPHRLDVIGSPSPIAADREVAGRKPLSAAGGDPGCCRCDLASHEAVWSKRRFVIEEKTRTGKEPVGLAVIGH